MLLDSGKKIGQFCYSEKAKYVGKCIVQFPVFTICIKDGQFSRLYQYKGRL